MDRTEQQGVPPDNPIGARQAWQSPTLHRLAGRATGNGGSSASDGHHSSSTSSPPHGSA
jgi:hypothetical protein